MTRLYVCLLYPLTDLESVKVTHQVKELIHPSLAIWCGNNEDLGANLV